MFPTNSDDPHRTFDYELGGPPAAPDGTADTTRSRAPEQGNTCESAPAGTAAREDDVGAVSVPGYEIEGTLGRGGMGVVYKARHIALKRTVALKMILAGGHAGPRELARFRIEAEAVARLQHSNIVQVFEIGEADGHPFCALEFVDGGNLANKITGKPQPAREAAKLVEALARAMQLAHSRNVVHRDLKPANILLTADGTPKITDFGLARQMDSDSGETHAGAVMGTPSYMAPEQASGRAHEAGPAADVYALGAILYDCLAGRPPFKGKTVIETLDQVRTLEPTPPSRIQSSVPLDLETICLKCLRKEQENRYASAAEFADDLGRYQRGEPILARPVGRIERAVKWVRRNPVVAGATVAVVLALVTGATVSYVKYLEAEAARVAETRRVEERDEAIRKRDAALHNEAEQTKIAENRRLDAVRQTGIAEAQKLKAEKEADNARKARNFLVSIFRIAETDVQGGKVTARQIVEDAEKRIPVEFASQPELRADLLKAIGEVKRAIAARIPYAMILEVRGTVALQSATGRKKAAVPQALLNLDDRLSLSPDGHVLLVFLSDLHKERVKPGRTVTIHPGACVPADAVLERDSSVLMTFARLPKGTFYMMASGGIIGQKMTKIQEDFEIATHVVTQGQWQAVMGNNPSAMSRNGGGKEKVLDISDEELKLFPVEQVSWYDAQAFIKKLNEMERGRGYRYRLPTEAEWEYACRGAATSQEECSFYFYVPEPTNDLSSSQANFNGNFPAGKAPPGVYLQRPTRVGAYPSNKLGLCDMHGNVAQWCSDDLVESSKRVLRGGHFNGPASFCHAGGFFTEIPGSHTVVFGFRLARVPVRDQ